LSNDRNVPSKKLGDKKHLFHLQVKTRSTFECVERYYHIVKRNKRRVQRPRRYLGDEQQSNVMALLAGTPSDVKRAMRIESADNSSNSSDDEMAINKVLYFRKVDGCRGFLTAITLLFAKFHLNFQFFCLIYTSGDIWTWAH